MEVKIATRVTTSKWQNLTAPLLYTRKRTYLANMQKHAKHPSVPFVRQDISYVRFAVDESACLTNEEIFFPSFCLVASTAFSCKKWY
jgi:hypothetical protein